MGRGSPSGKVTWGPKCSRFAFDPPGTTPCSASSGTPARMGIASSRRRAWSFAPQRHLHQMSEEAEPGHVGEGVHREPPRGEDLARPTVQCRHQLHHPPLQIRRRLPLLDGGGGDARADRLGEEQHVAGPRSGVGEDASGMHHPGDRHPVLGLGVVDRVATEDGDARLVGLALAALEDAGQRRRAGGPWRGRRPGSGRRAGERPWPRCRRGRWRRRSARRRRGRRPPGGRSRRWRPPPRWPTDGTPRRRRAWRTPPAPVRPCESSSGAGPAPVAPVGAWRLNRRSG